MDVNEERARWATEAANVARSLSRLADLASVLDTGPGEPDLGELNELAGRLHEWSLGVARELGRPALADELARCQQAFVDWRKLQARVRTESHRRDA